MVCYSPDAFPYDMGVLQPYMGMVYVDCDDYGNGSYRRIRKKSFNWYKNVIVTNGAEL